MKTLARVWALCLIAFIAISLVGSSKTMAQPRVGVSLQLFYSELEPYGEWIEDSQYGNIWVPDVEPGFRPYATRGHWILTEYGNTWVSDYPWGWAPFHYGRWVYDDFYGWVWIPGTEWGPAWVSWRSGGGYYGWAPLGPRVSLSIGIHIPINLWVFVPQHHIRSRYIYNYYVPRTRNVNIYHHTTVINNYYRNNNRTYVYGPRRSDIERVTHSRVPVYKADNYSFRSYKPYDHKNRDQSVYRPNRHNNQPSSRAVTSNRDRYKDRPDRGNYGNRSNKSDERKYASPERYRRPERSHGSDKKFDKNDAYMRERENRQFQQINQSQRQQRPERSYQQKTQSHRWENQRNNDNKENYRRSSQTVERSRPQRQNSDHRDSKHDRSRPDRGRGKSR